MGTQYPWKLSPRPRIAQVPSVPAIDLEMINVKGPLVGEDLATEKDGSDNGSDMDEGNDVIDHGACDGVWRRKTIDYYDTRSIQYIDLPTTIYSATDLATSNIRPGSPLSIPLQGRFPRGPAQIRDVERSGLAFRGKG